MDGPLWIDHHRPGVSEFPQPELRAYLERVRAGPINLIFHGPPGSGKTAAANAIAEEIHDDPEHDLMTINVADFFGMTKSEIAEDPRFRGFIDSDRRRGSKAAMINHILTEMASYPPVSGSFKTILLDNAEAAREDFQQALRRIMERHYEATQFVFTTRRVSALLLPIQSRCALIPVRSPTQAEMADVLEGIVKEEGVAFDQDGLKYVAGYADGNLRRAILAAQTTAQETGEITMESAYEVLDEIGHNQRIGEMLDLATAGEFGDARSMLDDLLIDDGYDGGDLLGTLLGVVQTRYDADRAAAITALAGEIEFDMTQGAHDRVHLSHFLSRLGPDAQTAP